MANIKSQIKRIKTNEKQRLLNKSAKSALRTQIKKTKLSIENEAPSVTADIQKSFSMIDKAAKNHLIHKNKAARWKSQLKAKK